MIQVREAVKQYRIGEQLIWAVDHLSLDVPKGAFISIMGHSGSGKTTLLSLIGGLTRPDGGQIVVEGLDINRITDEALSALRNEKIGFIFQFASLLPTLTAAENVLLPTLFSKERSNGEERAQELLRTVGLSDRLAAYPSQLSGGEQRRVALARALINDPEIVLADEPTGDLDEETEGEMIELFHKIHKRGVTLLMATHSPDLAREANRLLVMKRGRIE